MRVVLSSAEQDSAEARTDIFSVSDPALPSMRGPHDATGSMLTTGRSRNAFGQ